MGWKITPDTNVTATTESDDFRVKFPRNDGNEITYTIKYEENGKCGSMTVTQPGSSGPGPEPSDKFLITVNVTNNSGQDIYIMESFRFRAQCDCYSYCTVHAYTEKGKNMDTNNTSNIKIGNGETSTFTNVMCSGDSITKPYSYPSIIEGHTILPEETVIMTYAKDMQTVIVQGQPWTGHFDGAYKCNQIQVEGNKLVKNKTYTIVVTGIANDEKMPYCYVNGEPCA